MTERENDTVQEEADLDPAGDAAGRGGRDATDAVDASVSVESDGGATGAPESGDPERAPAREVEELREELESLNDRHLRLAAEFDNYRKRNQRDREALASRLQAELVGSLLDVLDDLQRVAEGGEDVDAEAVLEGVRLVEKKFVTVLGGAGVTPVDAEGERFDPELMEALGTVPTDDPEEDGHVADVFQRGYRLGDMLLRPARVRVFQHDETE